MLRYIVAIISFWITTVWSITPQEIDHYANETLQNWEIPGLALAVIQNGEDTYIQGYGVRERETQKWVNGQTLFQINSLTKAFTALTANLLVKEGKLDWDIPIYFYLPQFSSPDPEIAQHLSIRDLLSHRGGFPGNLYEGWRLFRNTQLTIDDLTQRLGFIEPVFPLRSRFNYDNIGYGIAGDIVAKISGTSWADFCQQQIFIPLNMNRTFLSYSPFTNDDNSALPHNYKTGHPIEGYNWEKDSLEAASGINSCAEDMSLWLHYCLKHYPDFAELLTPQIVIHPEDQVTKEDLPYFPSISHGQPQLHYGMGWWIYYIENLKICRHTGSSSGMQSVLAFVPEKGIGVVILSNQSKTPAVSDLMNRILDNILGCPEVNWKNQGLEAFAEVKENSRKWLESCELARNQNIPPSLPLDQYAGIYQHSGYGSIVIKKKESGLSIELLCPEETGNLVHWEGDQFEIVNTPSGSLKPFLCEFMFNAEGEIFGLKIKDLGLFNLQR